MEKIEKRCIGDRYGRGVSNCVSKERTRERGEREDIGKNFGA
jgi:hypothetical protein